MALLQAPLQAFVDFIVFLLVGLLTIVLFFRFFQERQRVYPPGPRGIPLFGSIFSFILTKRPQYETIYGWTKKFGPIFAFKLLGTRVYVLSDMDLIKEAFKRSPDIMNRTSFRALDIVFGRTNAGIGFSSGSAWKEQRQFFVNFLKRGLSEKQSCEALVQSQAEKLVAEIGSHEGAPFDPRGLLNIYVAIIVAQLTTGVSYRSDDKELLALNKAINRMFALMGPAGMMSSIPILSTIPSPARTELIKTCREIDSFVQKAITNHQTSSDQRIYEGSLIGSFQREMEDRTSQRNVGSFDEVNHRAICIDALAPGQDSTTTALHWLVFTLALHRDAQAKVRREICDVIGTSRLPNYADRHAMPFTQAVLAECMRLRPAIPLPSFHLATRDCKIGGYDVPRGSAVAANIWYLSLAPALWDRPQEFWPERFLDESGNADLKSQPITFGYGHRVCPAEGLARMEMFLFITSILQRFSLSLAEGTPSVNHGSVGLSYSPNPFKIRATRLK